MVFDVQTTPGRGSLFLAVSRSRLRHAESSTLQSLRVILTEVCFETCPDTLD